MTVLVCLDLLLMYMNADQKCYICKYRIYIPIIDNLFGTAHTHAWSALNRPVFSMLFSPHDIPIVIIFVIVII